ncbi:hypothetical protein ymoll0001_14140 [Yersinia mollaretii ATCC 43969]|uniref:Uncharacterized protein n=1 Tax=Yersinia mollaretii (strain ATCC 43969 / DSM 18520 / CIP 103324 / CNY 7263 / WAIP 204) TaxID=349967 RepID=A0ABP2EFG2_YERMW|nr:hypothetical protein ymoll0001_14140 [Yersinia mollaretii ATCC 43969]
MFKTKMYRRNKSSTRREQLAVNIKNSQYENKKIQPINN